MITIFKAISGSLPSFHWEDPVGDIFFVIFLLFFAFCAYLAANGIWCELKKPQKILEEEGRDKVAIIILSILIVIIVFAIVDLFMLKAGFFSDWGWQLGS